MSRPTSPGRAAPQPGQKPAGRKTTRAKASQNIEAGLAGASAAVSEAPHRDDLHSADKHSDDKHSDDKHSADKHSTDKHSEAPHSEAPHSDDKHSDDPHSAGRHSDVREAVREDVRAAARRANESAVVRWLARAGLVSNGLVHIIIGAIAIGVAFGLAGHADQSGALSAIANTPGGVLLLWIAAVSLFGLAFWQLTDAAWVTAPRRRTLLMRRLTDFGKAIGFAGVGLVTLIFALGAHESPNTASKLSAMLLQRPGGTVVLIGVALVSGGIGTAHLIRGVTLRFREENQPLTGAARVIVAALGLIGHVAKGVAFLIIAGLALVAALFTDATKFTGLDGALRYLTTLPSGALLLILIAIGFVAYGLYLIARARFLRR
ncbi:DUF1206 domain-containing protein [Rathayibacter soli]|uniref:DUF1206 domain-containing protein n=1 Tax=Rathayibacter soli TaxID=3144168 RepID=UPI0027E58524|nr:DUF1206 domain-containing protein [Glaciibacter superstes]